MLVRSEEIYYRLVKYVKVELQKYYSMCNAPVHVSQFLCSTLRLNVEQYTIS